MPMLARTRAWHSLFPFFFVLSFFPHFPFVFAGMTVGYSTSGPKSTA